MLYNYLFLLSLVITFIAYHGSGQEITWQSSFGGSGKDIATSVATTRDGGFIIAGYSDSKDGDIVTNYGGFDFWVVKVNELGVLQWQKNFLF